MLQTQKLVAPQRLMPFVSYVRATEAPARGVAHVPYTRLPDGQLELLLYVAPDDETLRVVGTRMHALHKPSTIGHAFLSVRFKPGGAYPFFGVPLSTLTDQLIDLVDLWGDAAHALRDALVAGQHREARVAAVARALTHRLATAAYEPASVPSVRRALRLVEAASVLPTVDALARELGTSSRTLRRSFLEVVGIGPKQYLRVVRFQRARRAVRGAPLVPLGTIAERAGYYDQSHFSADFQALSGMSPSAWRMHSTGIARDG